LIVSSIVHSSGKVKRGKGEGEGRIQETYQMWIAECGLRSKIQKSGVRIQNSGDRRSAECGMQIAECGV